MIALVIFAVLLLLLIIWGVSAYNSLVTLQNRYENAYAQIDVQLKRRYDLIPNLVETAKGYMTHERETLEAVTQARNMAIQASGEARSNPGGHEAMEHLKQAESQLGSALGRLMMVSEQYPDLKADRSMQEVMEELRSTENRIAFARQAYNDAVTVYNTKTETVPTSFIANAFAYNPADLFEITIGEERQAPRVSFS